jgi:hypothetical protein
MLKLEKQFFHWGATTAGSTVDDDNRGMDDLPSFFTLRITTAGRWPQDVFTTPKSLRQPMSG